MRSKSFNNHTFRASWQLIQIINIFCERYTPMDLRIATPAVRKNVAVVQLIILVTGILEISTPVKHLKLSFS